MAENNAVKKYDAVEVGYRSEGERVVKEGVEFTAITVMDWPGVVGTFP
jgi:hypothetical protein